MPIWLRKFTFNQLQTHFDKQNEEIKKAQSKNKSKDTTNIDMANTNKVNVPDFVKKRPSYSSTIKRPK
tara:strand:- start:852 stop:1055 length:204 start_codon:yes stop_codon:yes gene_type:complete